MNNLKPDIVCLRIPMTPRTIGAHLLDLQEWLEAHAAEKETSQFKRVQQRFSHWERRRESARPIEFNEGGQYDPASSSGSSAE